MRAYKKFLLAYSDKVQLVRSCEALTLNNSQSFSSALEFRLARMRSEYAGAEESRQPKSIEAPGKIMQPAEETED